MIEQTTLHNILTWIIAVILFIFQTINYFISRIKKIIKHGQKNTTVVTTDTIILSESNPNNNNAPENVITVKGLIQKHFDIPLIIAEDEPKVNDFIKNAQLLTPCDNYKEKKKIDQFMEHLVDDSYVARGLGLITANVGRESEFYLYSKYDNNFENVVIKLKGRQGEIGQITIPNQNHTNSIETKSIPMDYFYDEDRIKVTYTPFAEGVYTLTLVRNGLSICRSPYYISVEKSPTNSRSQIRLGTKKYKMVTKFAKAKHVPLETCDNSIPVIEPSKPSISRNILPSFEENSIRTDVMSIVTKFESNSINFQKNDQKRIVNISKKNPKTDLIDEISISANSNTQPKIETGNNYDTNINDLSYLSINSNSKFNDKNVTSHLDISNRNSKSNDINSIEIESNLIKEFNKKLNESIRCINDIPQIKNISSNHLEPTNSISKESLYEKSSDDIEKQNQTYKTNEPVHGQNQIETFLDTITVDKSEIKCIDNESCTHNEVSCFDDDDKKTVIVMKNINELESHPKNSINRQITDSAQYNINTHFTSVLSKITNDICEKCSIKVLRIISEFSRDINIKHDNNSNEICSSFETLLAQPISFNINIDNLFEKPISSTNKHKTDNLLTNSSTNMKLMDTIDKDIKYHYLNEIKPIDTTFNEIYCDINNTTTELMIKQNKHDDEITKTINDKITNNFTIPLTKNNIDKHKTDHLENILSTDNKIQIQVQHVQKSSEHNMDIDKTNKFQFQEYINKELNDINKQNGKILDTRDLVTINNDKKSNNELVTKELKAKNVIIPDKYKNIQSSVINNQTVLASMEVKLPTSKYKSEDIRQEISNISNTKDILPENQKLIIEKSIEPVLKNFKNKMVEKITQLYLNKNLASSDNTSIFETHNINLTNNLQKNQLNKQQLDNELKMMTLENGTPNFEIKKTNYDEKVQDTEIQLKNIPNDTSIKIDTTTESIKSNTSEETDVESNTDNKNEVESIKLKNKVNDLRKIQNVFKINEIEENNYRDTTIKLKPTKNVSIEQIKKQEDNVVKIKIFNDAKDLTIKKENIYKFPQLNIHENFIVEKQNSEVLSPPKNTNVPKNTAKETKELKIALESPAYNDAKQLNKHKIIREKIKNTDKTLEKNKSELIISYSQLANDSTPTTIIQLKREKDDSYKALNTKYKLTSLESTVNKMNCDKIKNKTIIPNNSSSAVIVTVNKENETSTIIDTSRVTEIKLDKIISSAESDTSTLINPPIKTQIQNIVVEIVTNNNQTIIDSVGLIIHEETGKNKEVANKNNPITNYWIQINNHEVYTKNAYNETIICPDSSNTEKPIDKDEVIETERPNISIQMDITIDDKLDESNKIEIEECIKTDLLIDTPTIPVQKSEKIENINETKTIPYTDSTTKDIEEPIDVEIFYKQKTLNNNLQTDKTKQNIDKESELSIDTSTYSVKQNNIIGKSIGYPLSIEKTTKPVKKSKVIKDTNENSDSSTLNKEKPIDKENDPKTEIEKDKSEDNINKEGEASSLIDTSIVSIEDKNIMEETIENPSPIETPIILIHELKVKDIKTETAPLTKTDFSTVNAEEPIHKENIPETEFETNKSEDTINPTDTPTVYDEEKVIMEETTRNPLLNEKPINSVESKVIDTNTETETKRKTNSTSKKVEKPIIKNNIPETETQTQTEKECAPCTPPDKPTFSNVEIIIIEETTEDPLPIETPIKSVKELKVEDSKTGSEISPITDSATVIGEELIDKENILGTENERENSESNLNKEGEPCSPKDQSIASDEEKIIIVETTEKPLPNEKTIIFIEDSKIVDTQTESKSIQKNDSALINTEEPINKEYNTKTEIEIDKSGDNMNPTDPPTVSDEEKVIIVKTAEMPLPNEKPIESDEDSKVVDSKTETEQSPITDCATVIGEELMHEENILETEIEREISEINIIKEGESCSPTDKSVASDEENIITVETTEKHFPNEKPIESGKDLKVVDSKTDSEKSPITDSATVIREELIIEENIQETVIEREISEVNINKDGESCSPKDQSVASYEENIITAETMEKPLPNDKPIKIAEESKTVESKTETESSTITDCATVIGEELIDKENILETEIEIVNSVGNINKEGEPCLPTDKSVASDEEKIIIVETTEKPLPNEKPIESDKDSKVEDSKTESEISPITDSTTVIREELIDKENILATENEKENSEGNNNKEDEPCSPTDKTVASDEEKIIIVETTEKPLPNEKPIEYSKDLKVVESKTETEQSPITDCATVIGEELIHEENILETEIEREISEVNINKEGEPCSPKDQSIASDEEKIIIVETTEKPLPNEKTIIFIEDSKIVDTQTESKSIQKNDSALINTEEPITKEYNTITEIEIDKSGDNMKPTDPPTVSDEEKVIIVKTAEMPLPNEKPIESDEDSKLVDSKTESQNSQITDSATVIGEELIDKQNILETENERVISVGNINKEGQPCSPTEKQTSSNGEMIILEETTENPLPIKTTIKSDEDLKVVDSQAEIESSPITDCATVIGEELIHEENILETEIERVNSVGNIYKEGQPCSPTEKQTSSNGEMIILEESTENPLPIKTTIKSDEDLKVVDSQTETESSPITDCATVIGEELIHEENILETEIEREISEVNINKEGEPCLLTDKSVASDEEKIIIIEMTEKPLPSEKPIESDEDSKVEDSKTGSVISPITDSATVIGEELIDKENILGTENERENSEGNINKEDEPCSPTDKSVASDEEKIIIVETTEKPLPNEKTIIFIEDSKTVNTQTESKSIQKNDSALINTEEPINKEYNTITEIEIDKSGDNMNPTDPPTVSDEEKVIIVKTAEMPLPNEKPIESDENSKVVDSKTETEQSPITDCATVIGEELIHEENILETEIEREISEVNINKEGEPCSPKDQSIASDEEKIIIVETTEKPLPNEKTIIFIEDSKIVDTQTESKSIQKNDSALINTEEPITKEYNTITEIEIDKSGDNMKPTDPPTVSDEEKVIIVKTAEMPLPNEKPIESDEDSKLVDSKTESQNSQITDSATVIGEELIDKQNILETENERVISVGNINKEGQPCSPTEKQTSSNGEMIILEETTENPLPIKTTIKSDEDLKVVDSQAEIESSPITDCATVIGEELIHEENILETEIERVNSVGNIYKEGQPCSPTEKQTSSNGEMIILEESTENPLPIKTTIKSDEDLKVVDSQTETESSPITDCATVIGEELIHEENILETEIEREISEVNINKDAESCSPKDQSVASDEEKIIIVETTEKPLPNEKPIESDKDSKVEDSKTESEILPITDSTTVIREELIDKENILATENEKENSEGNNNKEDEPCSPTDKTVASDEEKIIIVETTEKPLPNEKPIEYSKDLKVVESKTETEQSPITDCATVIGEELIHEENILETEIEREISEVNINKEGEPCSPTHKSVASDEEKIIIVETTEKPLPNEKTIESSKDLKVVDIKTDSEKSPITGSATVIGEELIHEEIILETEIEREISEVNINKDGESCSPKDQSVASNEENIITVETTEKPLPNDKSIKFAEESKTVESKTETEQSPITDSATVIGEEVIDKENILETENERVNSIGNIYKEGEPCSPIDKRTFSNEEMIIIEETTENPLPIETPIKSVKESNVVDSFNDINTAALVEDQKVEKNGTVLENILTINTSAASVEGQIQVEEVIKDESVILMNDSVTFDEMSLKEQTKIQTAKISSFAVMEELTHINGGDVMYTCEETLDKTIVEKDFHNETTTIDILVAVVEEQRAPKIVGAENDTQVLDDFSTVTVENLIKLNTEKETPTPIAVAKSEVENNEIKVMSENKTSTPVHLASTNTEQTETDMVTEIVSPNVNILNSNTKKILIDKEMITENLNNPKNFNLEFGETSKMHSLENEDNLQGKSYGIQKLEMSVQRMKTSNEDYYEKTFLQLEQTEKISVENKDTVDCENKNIINDKLYTVNESDLNAILCASSLEEALTLLDSKIKFKFKHRKLSNKANFTSHIPKIQTSESRSSGTNTNFTDAREFFKEIEKKFKK